MQWCILNSAKWKLLEFQGSRVGIYCVSFFLNFLQINNAIPCIFAGSAKKFIFTSKFFCASHLKIEHFELPLLSKFNIWKQDWLRCTPKVLYWPLVAVTIHNLEAILDSQHFLIHPVVRSSYKNVYFCNIFLFTGSSEIVNQWSSQSAE